MTSEVWQSVGPLSPCGTVSYPSNGLPGSTDVHKHARTIGSLSRWFLSLAEGRKVKLACMRMMAGVPEDGLFLVCCHCSKGLPDADSPRKYVHLETLLPAHWCGRCRNQPKKMKIDPGRPSGLSCAGVSDALAMIGGILLGSSLPSFFSLHSLTAHVCASPSPKAHLTFKPDSGHSQT